jgi:hypothetical protein
MKAAIVPFLICIILIDGCVFLPKIKSDEMVLENCETYTKKWELTHKQHVDFNSCSGSSSIETGICLSLAGVIVPAGSFIVSGSVVLIGNTLHWLEYKGRCESDVIGEDSTKLIDFSDN